MDIMRIFLQTTNIGIRQAFSRIYTIINIPLLTQIDKPIQGHFDMQCFAFPDKTIIVCPQVYNFYKKQLPDYTVICGNAIPAKRYPNDIAYNAALIGKNLFCKIEYTDSILLEQARKRGITPINVRQGYAKCSTIPIGEKALITADKSIYNAAKTINMDALLTTNSGVFLNGYHTGFIGGASICTDDMIIFCGDLSTHCDFKNIKHFITQHKKELCFFRNIQLTDLGSPHIF